MILDSQKRFYETYKDWIDELKSIFVANGGKMTAGEFDQKFSTIFEYKGVDGIKYKKADPYQWKHGIFAFIGDPMPRCAGVHQQALYLLFFLVQIGEIKAEHNLYSLKNL